MALDFPSSPVNGQVYDNFIYDAVKGTWKSISSGASPNYLVNPTITNAVITATAPNATTIPLIVNGASSQSSELQSWKNSSGSTLSYVGPSGEIVSTNRIIGVTPNDSGSTGGLISKAPAGGSQTSAYIQFVNNAHTVQYGAIAANSSNVITINGKVTMPDQPVYAGTLNAYQAGSTSNYFPVTTNIFINGFTKSGNNRLTAQVAGKYYVAAQQLINTSGTATYFNINKNGTTVAYAYSNADDTYDVIVSTLVDLQVNDYIEIYYAGTTSYTWGTPHSYLSVFKVA